MSIKTNLTKKQNRSFGIVLLIFIALSYFLIDNVNFYVEIFLLILSFFIVIISIYLPNLFSKPNYLWLKFGIILGNITSFIVLSVIFLLIFTPVGFLLRISNVISIKCKYNPETKSYWENRKEPLQSMKQQF